MEVFHFDKSMMERLEEAQNILVCNKIISASRVVEEWSYAVELLIEPTGWQAIWKISRVICEELKIKYPTTVYGNVNNVLFKELKAIFTITAIQDDDIHLPGEHEVPLTDLWPTKIQENPAINIEATANCVDMIRFFFQNIWMPWDSDNDEDIDWATKYLESRIRFCYDLKADMNQMLASHVRALLVEARDIQQRKEYLELDLSDDEDMNESKSQITDLMHLHIRLATIRNEIELLENPKLRKVFEEHKFQQKKIGDITVVMHENASLSKQIQDLEKARQIVGDEKVVKMSLSLQNSLMTCGCVGKIYLTVGSHSIKFLENLNSSIIGITPFDNSIEMRMKMDIDDSMQSVIMATDFENILLNIAGRLEIKNVILDCRKVRTGILVREGFVRFENCTFIGDKSSSTSTAIIMLDNTTVGLENCVIKEFSTAIAMRGKTTTSLALTNSIIYNSSTGIECNDTSCITFKQSKIMNAAHYAIVTTIDNFKDQINKLLLDEINELKLHSIALSGDCEFENCIPKNIVIFNKGNMHLLKSNSTAMLLGQKSDIVDVNGKPSEVETFNETLNTTATSSDNECSIIVIDD